MIQLINLLGPSIFWTTLAVIFVTLTIATYIGSVWIGFFPFKLRTFAKFYLSPALGFASLTIISTILGRFFPLGDSIVAAIILGAIFVLMQFLDFSGKPTLLQLVITNLFAVLCGISILVPLYVYGGFNASNDAFTYLAHGDWLQHHAFNETISNKTITPLNTQVAMYQHGGFRMGASFLLAFIQAALNLHWAYEAYPGLIICSVAACCLAVGFPISRWLRAISRPFRLGLLSLPALSLGGLVFGANLGFLPQTIGLAFSASVLFWAGPIFRWTANTKDNLLNISITAVPGAILITSAILAYSEFGPFLVLSIGISGLILFYNSKSWAKLLVLAGTLVSLSAILLNTEIPRAIIALRAQSGAVVGSPVDWTLLGYFAHAIGVHGGAWDDFQWTLPQFIGSTNLQYGLIAFVSMAGIFFFGRHMIWKAIRSGPLLPAGVILLVFTFALFYFRYAVQSPFDKGTGQSWSQFKLADWAHPFTMALLIVAFANLKQFLGKSYETALFVVIISSSITAGLFGISRIQPFVQFYPGVSNFNEFYQGLRIAVSNACPRDAAIYLELEGQHYKFRQMATLYLYDRKIKSNWMDDGYIFQSLPIEMRTQRIAIGDCVIEPTNQQGWISQGVIAGPYRIGLVNNLGNIRIASVINSYQGETDGKNWWYWIEKKIEFKMPALPVMDKNLKTRISFEYQTSGERQIRLKIVGRDGIFQEIGIESDGKKLEAFNMILEIPPNEIVEIILQSSGNPVALGSGDPRMASLMVRNIAVSSENSTQ